ncbi:DUF7453 family protein [Gimesia maris]|uniref:DUF7453 family protein n=1 Tax=Gimesia maris TaxID=122 RepID=UPI0032ED3B6C
MLPFLNRFLKSNSFTRNTRSKRKLYQAGNSISQVQLLEERRLLAGMLTSDDVIVRSGDNAPNLDTGNNDGNFSNFSEEPNINESGLVLFQANVTGSLTSSNSGLFQGSSAGTILNITRQKQPVPAIQEGTLYDGISGSASLIPLPFNDSGQAVFVDRFNGANYWENTGIFLGSNGNGPLLLVQEGSDAPGATNGSTNGKFDDLENTYVTVNNSGRVAFRTDLYDTDNGNADNRVIFSSDVNGNLIEIVREGQLIPGSTTNGFTDFYYMSINNAGQVAFWGHTLNSSVPDGIYISNGDGSPLRVVMQEGEAFGSFGEKLRSNGLISSSLINEAGDIAFRSHVDEGDNGTIVRSVFVVAGNGTLKELARNGDILPDNEIYYDSGLEDLVLNNRGDVVFTGKNALNNKVLFRSDDGSGRSDLKTIVKEGQAVPDSDLQIYNIQKYTLNDAGQVAFTASIWDGSDSSTLRDALFFYDDVTGLKEIVRTGDAFEGATISQIYFAGNNEHVFLENNGDGINNNGEVTFSFKLDNDLQFIAIVDADLSEEISLRVVSTPTVTDGNGESTSLPQNQDWINEWDSFWVEIWVSTANSSSQGIAAVNFDFSYNTQYTSATAIEFGSSFTQNQSGIIDDETGLIENLSAETTETDLGVNDRLLFARIQFDSLPDDQVSLDLEAQSIGPFDLGFELISPQINVVADVPEITTVNPNIGASIWANPFDLNDDDKIDFRDLILQISMYNTRPSESNSEYAWFADYDQNDRIDYRDLVALVMNYGKSKNNQSVINYPNDYPDAWNHRLLVTSTQQSQQSEDYLSQTAAEHMLETAKNHLTPHLDASEQSKLVQVQVQIKDLAGDTLGLASANTVILDQSAAGYGWFVDKTPLDHSEYAFDSRLTLIALSGSEAEGKIDLYTVIYHELGHLLGYEHDETGVMEATLDPGVRKLTDWVDETDHFFASLKDETELLSF